MTDEKPSLWLRLLVFLLVSGAMAAGGWWFWQRDHAAVTAPALKAKGAMRVQITKVVKENYALDLDAIGTVRAFESADISTNVTEAVTGLFFKDGDFVKKGTLLASLSDDEEQAMLASARATLSEEEREIDRLKNLVKDGAAPEARLEERKTLADIAKQKIREAEAKMADRQITAPFDGWLGLRRISVGALVSPGTIIASIDKIDVVNIDFAVPETYLDGVAPGTSIVARASANSSKDFKGTLAQMDTRIDAVTRSIMARAEVPNPDRVLKPGMLVMVKLALEPRASLSIPERTLVPVGAKKCVFTLAGEKAKRVEVETGRRKPGYVEVTKGLTEGQVVITDGLVGLLDNAAVMVTADFKEPSPEFNPEEKR